MKRASHRSVRPRLLVGNRDVGLLVEKCQEIGNTRRIVVPISAAAVMQPRKGQAIGFSPGFGERSTAHQQDNEQLECGVHARTVTTQFLA